MRNPVWIEDRADGAYLMCPACDTVENCGTHEEAQDAWVAHILVSHPDELVADGDPQ